MASNGYNIFIFYSFKKEKHMSYLLNENEMERIVDTLKNAKACDYKLNLSESPPSSSHP